MRKSTFGFTLIETLIVVSIIATLSAIMYTSFDNARASSRDQRRVSDIAGIKLALELYFNQNRQYPGTLGELVSGGYIQALPEPPSNAGQLAFQYNYVPLKHTNTSPVCTSYQLWTSFETTYTMLSQKRGLDSTSEPTANGLFKCGVMLPAVNALGDARVYDVTP